ncbi:GSCFA domain-containing protein [Maribellus sediminis]|uniref:GSCFA domain-containing protein n=1 Tax=Maribellus sediminis TaxID=2696285 RepID=UPI001431E66A|nr:GSCFA domain-containing protein [Maribellus sediminis]
MGDAKFQTRVAIPDYQWKTGYQCNNIFMGSCFTENVGQRMEDLKYPVDINPFGILYNPMSVASGLELLLAAKHFSEDDLIEHNGLWHSFSHHGRFSTTGKSEMLEGINDRLEASAKSLKEADFLFLTFGTAWIYRYNKTGKVVSNCHKIPAAEFNRERLSVTGIVATYKDLLPRIRKQNSNLKVVFTVSPIRHWKDGAIENQRSKATLLLAIDELQNQFPGFCTYFPSYEIVMDELRDYRFYAADMLHISDVAIDHIWQIFEESLIDAESRQLAKKVLKIRNAVSHRPFNMNTPEFNKFIQKFYKNILELEAEYPYLNLKLEKEHFIRHL